MLRKADFMRARQGSESEFAARGGAARGLLTGPGWLPSPTDGRWGNKDAETPEGAEPAILHCHAGTLRQKIRHLWAGRAARSSGCENGTIANAMPVNDRIPVIVPLNSDERSGLGGSSIWLQGCEGQECHRWQNRQCKGEWRRPRQRQRHRQRLHRLRRSKRDHCARRH